MVPLPLNKAAIVVSLVVANVAPELIVKPPVAPPVIVEASKFAVPLAMVEPAREMPCPEAPRLSMPLSLWCSDEFITSPASVVVPPFAETVEPSTAPVTVAVPPVVLIEETETFPLTFAAPLETLRTALLRLLPFVSPRLAMPFRTLTVPPDTAARFTVPAMAALL